MLLFIFTKQYQSVNALNSETTNISTALPTELNALPVITKTIDNIYKNTIYYNFNFDKYYIVQEYNTEIKKMLGMQLYQCGVYDLTPF